MHASLYWYNCICKNIHVYFQDPFEMNVKKRAKGTVDEPTLIPSLYEKRLVGCICKFCFFIYVLMAHCSFTEYCVYFLSVSLDSKCFIINAPRWKGKINGNKKYYNNVTIPQQLKMVLVCAGEEDAVSINWMYLHKGEPRRCECGYWFKLVDLQQ